MEDSEILENNSKLYEKIQREFVNDVKLKIKKNKRVVPDLMTKEGVKYCENMYSKSKEMLQDKLDQFQSMLGSNQFLQQEQRLTQAEATHSKTEIERAEI